MAKANRIAYELVGDAMHYLELQLATLEKHLALDEALLLQAEHETHAEVLNIWEWLTPAVVVGAGSKLAQDVFQDRCHLQHIPILRRASGGGTVLLGRGCLCFSLILDKEKTAELEGVRSSYAFIFKRIRQMLEDFHPRITHAGTSDLAIGSRKFSGNAQQRKRRFLLHHGTLLYEFDLTLPGRYLQMPGTQPGYRAGREHETFLANVPLPGSELKRRLQATWEAHEKFERWPQESVEQLVREKYARREWIQRF